MGMSIFRCSWPKWPGETSFKPHWHLVSNPSNVLKPMNKQECIPVGCVLSTAVAVCWGVSATVHAGISPGCGPGDPPGVGLETPPTRCGPGNPPLARPLNLPPWVWAWRLPQARPLNFPTGCRPGDPHRPDPSTSLRVRTWRPARHTGMPPPPPKTCKACWDTTCTTCWDTNRMNRRY